MEWLVAACISPPLFALLFFGVSAWGFDGVIRHLHRNHTEAWEQTGRSRGFLYNPWRHTARLSEAGKAAARSYREFRRMPRDTFTMEGDFSRRYLFFIGFRKLLYVSVVIGAVEMLLAVVGYLFVYD